ncbi:MAG: hypothetical protein ABI181_13625 [Mycobacteriaceae bacterium]
MTATRSVLVTLGVAAGVYGLVLLLFGPMRDPVSVALWFAGGVIVHDFLLSPLLVGGGVGAARVLPSSVRGPLVYGVLATLALVGVAAPVLFRSHGVGNQTVLDRSYPLGFAIAVGVVWVAVAVALVARVRRSRGMTPIRLS